MWAFRCAIGTFDPDYYQPVTAFDHLAVWSYSAAIALSAAVAWSVAWVATTHRVIRAAGVVCGAGFALAAVANGLEDGFALRAWGSAYVNGAIIGAIGAVVVAVALLAAGSRMLAAAAGMLLLPLPFLSSWIGLGVVLPAALVARHAVREAEARRAVVT